MLKKKWVRIVLIILALLAVLGIWVVWPERPNTSAFASLNQKYQVEIVRDEWGVPHIYGKTDPDAAFGLAYAHAEDDFLTIQQTLAASQGMLAAVYGQGSAPADYLAALLRVRDVVDSGYASLSPQSRAVMEAYADGLNYYAYQHPDQALLPGLFPITGKAIVSGSVYKSPLFFGLDGVIGELFADTRQRPVAVKGQAVTPPAAVEAAGWLNIPGLGGSAELYGSNTFALAPARTTDGSTFLTVNSHQPWTGPVAWYEVHIHSDEGWEASGATFPGTPAVIHGHNRDLGWAFTVNHPDLADVFVLEMNPENKNQYRFDGEWKTLEVRQVIIWVKLYGRLRIPVPQEVLWSVYGPAVRRPHGVYAIRYAGYGKVNIFEQLYRMNRAQTFAEWQQAMKEGGLPNFNAGYADAKGNIYYLYNAMLPLRSPDYDWSQYLPGNTSETLWTESLPFEQLPQVFNPPAGFVQNANSTPFQATLGAGNPNPADYAPAFGIETTQTNRALRALELLGTGEKLSFEQFRAVKFDLTFSQQSDVVRFVDFILQQNLSGQPSAVAAQSVLKNWDFKADLQSTGMTVMEFWLDAISAAQDLRWSGLVDTEISDAALVETFIQAADTLQSKFGQVTVPWGEVNRLRRGTADLARDGGPDLLRASYGQMGTDGTITGDNGDGYVMLVHWDAAGQVEAFSIHQFGSATLDAASEHYADQSPLYVRHELKPTWFREEDVRAHASRVYKP